MTRTGARQTGAAGWWLLVLLVVLVLAFVGWRWHVKGHMAVPAPRPAASATVAPASTVPQYPIADVVRRPVLPVAAGSVPPPATGDPRTALLALAQGAELPSLLASTDVIARIVATVDALPRKSLAAKVLPLHPPAGNFRVDERDGQPVVGSGNAERYAPYLALAEHVDLAAAVDWYARNYAAFQQAYRRLGYPRGHFNDRLVQVIDELLATPRPSAPPALVPHKGGWAYVDPRLQALGAGQRILLRLPAGQRAMLDNRLRRLRALVTGSATVAGAVSAGIPPRP